ncbi:MAG: ABC transporter ATP-binding protein [Armatimonadota bacterium]|nr:ABC transporter ATP-binding protein [Armatimonadota bacterium]MCX7778144.1 ABC transporter ATP-binding protein [Armatimonadota bacterium]MDW8024498.1 ABC transporter ATP-binding protein [Armatimonadota bacterium]
MNSNIATSKPLVTVKGIWLGYGRNVVLKDVEFDVHHGDFIGLVGPNGAGKTTLLKALLGMLRPIRGSIIWHTKKDEVRFGYVPQRELLDELYPLSAIDIVLMSLIQANKPWRRYTTDDIEIAHWALEQAGIADIAIKPYRLLSGGQRQRLLVARALAAKPNVLVLDEPTNGLDLPTEHGVMELIARLHHEHSITIIFATHLLNVVINYANRIGIVHDGRVRMGTASEMLSQEKLREAYGIETGIATVDGRKFVFVKASK